ncbi:MAG: hypothetical protein F4056_09715 [Chloroflexi bacterium]|nr:hypothetical protein [Chloroflexota bacterium]
MTGQLPLGPTGEEEPQRALLALGGGARVEEGVEEALTAAGCEIVGRCLDARSLLRMAEDQKPDLVVLNDRLSGYSDATTRTIYELGIQPVLISEDPDQAGESRFGQLALRLRAEELAETLPELAERGELLTPPGGADHADADGEDQRPSRGFAAPAPIVAVTSGKGAPGKTAVSLGLAAALGRELGTARVRLVDFDLRGGNIAPWLNLDQRRGLASVRLPGIDSPERAARELEETRFHCLALAGLERGIDVQRLIVEDASRCLGAVAGDAPSEGIVVCDCGSQGQPAFAVTRARVVVLVCGADPLSAWNTRGTVETLLARGASIVLAVNGVRPGAEPLVEIREALGLGPQTSVRGDRRGVPAVAIPYDGRVPALQRPGAPPDFGTLRRSFRQLAFAVLGELASRDRRWREPAARFGEPPGGLLERIRQLRRRETLQAQTGSPGDGSPAAAVVRAGALLQRVGRRLRNPASGGDEAARAVPPGRATEQQTTGPDTAEAAAARGDERPGAVADVLDQPAPDEAGADSAATEWQASEPLTERDERPSGADPGAAAAAREQEQEGRS